MSHRQGGAAGGGDESLRSSLLKSRIAKLPHLPAVAPSQWSSSAPEERDEDDDDGLGSLSMAPPLRGAENRNRRVDLHCEPLSAKDCFQQALEVDVGGGEDQELEQVRQAESDSQLASSSSPNDTAESVKATFRVYYTPPSRKRQGATSTVDSLASLDTLQPPESEDDEDGNTDPNPGTVFFFHHGAGYSALSYALTARHITAMSKGEAGVLAFDCRGHGRTRHEDPAEAEQLSLENLTADCITVLAKLFPPSLPQPTLILVGHSMGGAVVVSLCHALSNAAKTVPVPRVAGVAVLDVVEGTAMSALPAMKTIVSALPRGFDSIEEAIRWHVESGTIVNAQSAQRSVPSLLKRNDGVAQDGTVGESAGMGTAADAEPVEELLPLSPAADRTDGRQHAYTWRADLLATEPYWAGWFQGLSSSFLSVKCARLLILAGTDRLDKELMIGQMQGKYQLVVFADVGHSLQEDAPQRTAQTLFDFWKRNEGINVSAIRGTSLNKVGDR